MKKSVPGLRASLLLVAMVSGTVTTARAELMQIEVIPSSTDTRIKAADKPHIVLFEKGNTTGNLLLWMPGTGGHPKISDKLTFPKFAALKGYRVVLLSYIDDKGISNVCIGRNLKADQDCSAKFRRKRIFGDDTTDLIDDQPQDAIVNRLVKLLQYLKENHPNGKWGQYLDHGELNWERIAVGGQSQGGGMAAFIAKEKRVPRVIMLSGGWDKSAKGEIATWYSGESATPPDRWYATYHVEERTAQTMAEIYHVLGIPPSHVGALDLPVKGPGAHTEALTNSEYKPWWEKALGQTE